MTKNLPEMSGIAVVIPFYNEEDNLRLLLSEIEENLRLPVHFVLVDDGSSDKSLEVVKKYRCREKNRKTVVHLTRNFGHQQALMSGFHHVSSNIQHVLVLDADFQDDPADIGKLYGKYQEGYDCVYAVRKANSGNCLINFLTGFFYVIQEAMLSFTIPRYAGTYSIFNRSFLEKILMFPEREIYFPAIRAYVGMKQTGVALSRSPRRQGHSKVGLRGLLNLSIVGIIGFSVAPMRLVFLFGIFMVLFCLLVSTTVFFLKIFHVTEIPGVTTILITICMLSGIQIMFTGMIGEYIGKLFIENKKRPLWLVQEIIHE